MNTQTAVAKRDDIDITPERQGVMELMRLAVEKGDVGIMERMEALFDRQNAKQAKREFDGAMAAFIAECPVILKSKPGVSGKYNFAPLDHIVVQVKPLIVKHGFSYRIETDESENGFVKAAVIVIHSAGHSERSSYKVPVDAGRNRDGNKLMSGPQAYGAALTSATRRAFCNAFGILTADADTDGAVPQVKADPMRKKDDTKALKAELWALLKPVRGSESDWEIAQRWLVDECAIDVPVSKMSADEIKAAINKVKGKLHAN